MCRVKANPADEKVLGSIVQPCAKTGVLCIKVHDDKNQLVDDVFLRFHNENTTVHTEIRLNSSDEKLFASDHFQMGGLPAGNYEVIFEKKDGMDFIPNRSTPKFEIAAGCFTVIELVYVPEMQGSIQDLIPDPILENRELISQMMVDIPEDAINMYCKDYCIDFRTLLEKLNKNTALENSQITLLGVHGKMPFSIFNELRGAFDVVDYSSTALRLNVSAGNPDIFLDRMHKNNNKVVFLVPPTPRAMSHTRTSKEFIWYNDNPLCKEHVTFVFGSYNVLSQKDIDLYLTSEDQTMRKKQIFRQYSKYLKPQLPCPKSTSEEFKLAKEEYVLHKDNTIYKADDHDDIDIDIDIDEI